MKKNRFVGRAAVFFLIAGLFSVALFSCKENEEDKIKPITITDIILQNDQFSMLRDIMLYTEMSDDLRSENYTLFAPDNEAFEKANVFSSSEITSLPKDSARIFLESHIIKNRYKSSDLKVGAAQTITKTKLNITKVDSVIEINMSNIVMPDVNAANGVIHVIDSLVVRK